MKTIAATLHSLLKPLEAILIKAETARDLAFRTNLPPPFIATIKNSIFRLEAAYDQLLEISTALDPSLRQIDL